eukprot:6805156-Lingulodinium_polyedra.AAC.1
MCASPAATAWPTSRSRSSKSCKTAACDPGGRYTDTKQYSSPCPGCLAQTARARPGTSSCDRRARHGVGRRIATPPLGPPLAPRRAGEE